MNPSLVGSEYIWRLGRGKFCRSRSGPSLKGACFAFVPEVMHLTTHKVFIGNWDAGTNVPFPSWPKIQNKTVNVVVCGIRLIIP